MCRKLELYVHIPFCVRKCAYCDFLSAPAGEKERKEYVDALIKEMEIRRDKFIDYRVTTVFLGGGTPSLLGGEETARIFRALRETFNIEENAEITLEANPGTVTREKLRVWKECGINRLSIGLQSADNRELRVLGRIHTYQEFLHTWRLVEEAGFQNRNIDLICALPGQTKEGWEKTLRAAADLGAEHISAYSLIIEEGTLFHQLSQMGVFDGEDASMRLPSEDEEREIYEMTERILQEYGYHRYEISNYAKQGHECKHNMGYWERKEYLGLGLGAASLVGETRFHNAKDMKTYLENPAAEEEWQQLSVREQMEEFIFLGLRLMRGISKQRFKVLFGVEIGKAYPGKVEKLKGDGLLGEEGDRIYLTPRGIDVSNYVFAQFL